jgi:DNA polymerase-4
MDAFYASVEQRDNPDLRGKPVAVGGSIERGVVAAASYEARKFGVRSAMSSKIAAQKCPELIFVKPDFEKYKAVSRIVMSVFHQFTDLVEPLSLDEAYLDVTENKAGILIATDVAREIKRLIKEETSLTASAGVSYCKFIAKIASGYQKPDGLTVITPARADAFIERLPIGDFFGVGKVTAEKMKQSGIHFGRDLKALSLEECISRFGSKSGTYYYEISRGIDNRAVRPDRIRKSIGAEETFDTDLSDTDEMKLRLDEIAEDVARRCTRAGSAGRTVTLKIKYRDFVLHTRSKSFNRFINDKTELATIAHDLLLQPEPPVKPVRLLGISVHNLDTDPDTRLDQMVHSLQLKLKL